MLEIKVTIEAPALSEAITHLAEAIKMPTMVVEPVVNTKEPEQPQTAAIQPQQPVTLVEPTPTVMTAPVTPAPVATAPVQPQPQVQPQTTATLDLNTLSRAGAALVDQGKMDQIMAVLQKYNVMAITQLDPSLYPAFANDLRDLGAAI